MSDFESTSTPRPPQTRQRKAPTKKHYNQFVHGLELEDIWLESSSFQNNVGPDKPDGQLEVVIETQLGFGFEESAILCKTRFIVRFKHPTDPEDVGSLSLTGTFAAAFTSAQPPDGPLVRQFAELNMLPMFWPYLRQFIYDSLGRTNWPPFTLGALKQDSPDPPG